MISISIGNRFINRLIVVFSGLLLLSILYHQSNSPIYLQSISEDLEVNNYGSNVNLVVNKSRYRDVPTNKLKNILFWNLKDLDKAYGFEKYDVGEGHEHFYLNH